MTIPPNTLWNRSFLLYWLGMAGSALGDALVFVALPFLVLSVDEAPGALATAVVLGSAPRFLGPLVGSLTDRVQLKIPLIVIGTLRASLFAGIGLSAITGTLGLGLLYGAAALNGLLNIFVFSAGSVLLPRMVPSHQLGRANSFLQAAVMGLPLVGYGVAGVLIASVGPGRTTVVAAPLFFMLTVVVLRIDFPIFVRPAGTNVLSDLWSGARYIFARAPLATIIAVSFSLNVALAALNVAMPLVMTATGRGATGYGMFQSVTAVGTLVGILGVSLVGTRLSAPLQIGLAAGLTALGFTLFIPGGFMWLMAGAGFVGFGLGMTEVAAVTLLQLAVPDGMRGKVLGLILGVNALGLTLSAWFVGLLASRVPMSVVYLANAALLTGVTILWLSVSRQQASPTALASNSSR